MADAPKTPRTFAAALGFAAAGIARTFKRQPNFRRELVIGAAALTLAVWLQAPIVPIVLVSALVLSLELVNSAVEAAIDLASPERHPLAGAAKDAAAGAVLLAAIAAVVVGLLVLGPPLLARLGLVP